MKLIYKVGVLDNSSSISWLCQSYKGGSYTLSTKDNAKEFDTQAKAVKALKSSWVWGKYYTGPLTIEQTSIFVEQRVI